MITSIKNWVRTVAGSIFDAFLIRSRKGRRLMELEYVTEGVANNSRVSDHAKLYPPYRVLDASIGDYTYISPGSAMSHVQVGKFCSIGPNFFAGYGIHPLDGISTHPMFYSTIKQNGFTLSATDKFKERAQITIGNDVFIGANVTVLDGITIGHGAVIGAGAVVSKNIPPYAIAVGTPIEVIRYRFDEVTIEKMLKIAWWDWPLEKLKTVERDFTNVNKFIADHLL